MEIGVSVPSMRTPLGFCGGERLCDGGERRTEAGRSDVAEGDPDEGVAPPPSLVAIELSRMPPRGRG